MTKTELTNLCSNRGEVFQCSVYMGIATATITQDEELVGWWEVEVYDEAEFNSFLEDIAKDIELDVPDDVLQFIENL